jgi:uncharacterized membrane protein
MNSRPFFRLRMPSLAGGIAALMILSYLVVFGALSLLQHEAFRTSVFDLGNVDQTLWNTTQGRILYFTTQPRMGNSRLGMHVEPILLPMALLYFVFPAPETLLVLQTLAIGLSAWPVFLLARRKLGSPWAGVAFVAAYLLWPGLESANLFEFHAVALSPFFMLWAFLFLEEALEGGGPLPNPPPFRGRESHPLPSPSPLGGRESPISLSWALFALFAFLALSTKEDISLLLATLGLYVFLVRRRRAGLLIAAVGAAWFLLSVQVVIPHFRQGRESPFLFLYEEWGSTPVEIAWTMLSRPGLVLDTLWTAENGRFLRGLLLPFAFLSLLELPLFLVTLPSLAISLLSANPLIHQLERYHYAAPFAPFVVVSAIYGMKRLAALAGVVVSRLSRSDVPASFIVHVLSVALVAVSLYYHYQRGFSPLARPYRPIVVNEHHRLGHKLAAAIPAGPGVGAQAELIPHVSQRELVTVWPYNEGTEYIFLDISHPNFDNRRTAEVGAQEHLFTWLALNDSFRLVAAEDGYMVLKRGAKLQPFRPPFFTFAHAEDPRPQYPLVADFDTGDGGALRFLGFDVYSRREEEPQFMLYWETQRPLEQDYFFALYLLDESEAVVGATIWKQPTMVWYPTSMWPEGGTYKVLFNTFPWWTGDRERFGIALGVCEGEDPWLADRRLPPRIVEGPAGARLLDEGTLLRLIGFRRSWEIPYPVEGK